MRAVCCLVLGLFALSSSRAQTIKPINLDIVPTGEVVGAIVGIAAVAVAGVGSHTTSSTSELPRVVSSKRTEKRLWWNPTKRSTHCWTAAHRCRWATT